MLFLYKCLRCLIIHVGLVVEGGLAILYGMVWPHVYVGLGDDEFGIALNR